jgi:Family of unknown function (DUF5706)
VQPRRQLNYYAWAVGFVTCEEVEFAVSLEGPVEGVMPAVASGHPARAAENASPSLPDEPSASGGVNEPAANLAFRTPLQEHAPAADTKAAAILTALSIMFTVLAKLGAPLAPMLRGESGGGASTWSLLGMIVTWALLSGFVGLSLGAIWQAFRTFSPRFPNAPPSLAFFQDIAKLSRAEYLDKVSTLSDDEALRHILVYNHNLSRICVEKFVEARRALKLFEGAFVCWLLLLLLLKLLAP